MRREPTPFEGKLWYALRARRFEGAKFRRQVVIDRYIVDFACRIPKMIVIEVDGDTHGAQIDYDARRDAELRSRGYDVLRFTNRDVHNNFEGVLMAIQSALSPSGERRSRVAAEERGSLNWVDERPLSPTLSPEGERE